MDTNQPDPAPVSRARTPWAVAVGVFAGGLLIGLILASVHVAGAQTATPTPGAGKQYRQFLKGDHGFGHRGFGGGALHGQFVVPKPGGGYQTILTQRGTVMSVSGSSITVKSEDGYTHTYSVDNNTLVAAGNNGITDVAKGDTVRVLAVGDAAKDIIDGTKIQSLRQKYWAPNHGHKDETPEPSGSASATSTSFNA